MGFEIFFNFLLEVFVRIKPVKRATDVGYSLSPIKTILVIKIYSFSKVYNLISLYQDGLISPYLVTQILYHILVIIKYNKI